MEKLRTDRPLVLLLMLLAGAVFAAGINWGLPSKDADAFLTASATPEQQSRLAGMWLQKDAGDWNADASRGSDVAQHPTTDRSHAVTLLGNPPVPSDEEIAAKDATFSRLLKIKNRIENEFHETHEDNENLAENLNKSQVRLQDARDKYFQANNPQLPIQLAQDVQARAQIIRRYRLYSYQPDEMITFRALARMHLEQNDFDPRLYQYGGLWIYPVGGLLKAASLMDLTRLIGDPTFYLDHPQEFAAFYIVARAYSALWGMIGVAVIFALLRRLGASRAVAAMGAIAFVLMPVVINLAHEAKPHLAGTVLILAAVLAASHYVSSGKWRWAILASLLCGLAVGMVLSGLVGIVLIPAMTALRRDGAGRLIGITVMGVIIMVMTYFATNPYVAMNLVNNPEVVRSNLANTSAMYPVHKIIGGVGRCAVLVAAGTSLPLAVVGLVGALLLALWKKNAAEGEATESAHGIGWMLAILSGVVLIQMALVAAGKPGEFGRFALLPDVALLIAAFAVVGRWVKAAGAQLATATLLAIIVAGFGAAYECAFIRDIRPTNASRMQAAEQLIKVNMASSVKHQPTVLIPSDPAPYCLPPVDLFRWRIVLLSKDGQPGGESLHGLVVRPDDAISLSPLATPLSWANKSFVIESH